VLSVVLRGPLAFPDSTRLTCGYWRNEASGNKALDPAVGARLCYR